MTKYLVIGGLGFLGFHIVEDLIELGKEVAAFDIRESKNTEQLELIKKFKLKIYIGDFTSSSDMENAIKDFNVDVIIQTGIFLFYSN
jgi:nucleoside-diphosphate-sugar epimerase